MPSINSRFLIQVSIFILWQAVWIYIFLFLSNVLVFRCPVFDPFLDFIDLIDGNDYWAE